MDPSVCKQLHRNSEIVLAVARNNVADVCSVVAAAALVEEMEMLILVGRFCTAGQSHEFVLRTGKSFH
ncbi:hypothetical protein GCM10020255_001230 [Rhodococcus baikonurensis]